MILRIKNYQKQLDNDDGPKILHLLYNNNIIINVTIIISIIIKAIIIIINESMNEWFEFGERREKIENLKEYFMEYCIY